MENKFLKIVYFDEVFVADFMQIIAGGNLKKTTEFISELNSGIGGSAEVGAQVGTEISGLPKIFQFLSGTKLSASGEVSAELSRKSDKIVRNILENTMLADFIALLEADKKRKIKRCSGIKIFSNVVVKPEINSFSYFMLIAPFLEMINGEFPIDTDEGEMKLDITKIEAAIEKGRGYYEFLANIDGKETILRFNKNAFRNSYTMSDLPKMQLTYYAIRVGEISKSDLQVQREFEFGTTQISKRADYSTEEENIGESSMVEVFDVVLAGVLGK